MDKKLHKGGDQKRRRLGLNSRVDRMIDSLDFLRQSPLGNREITAAGRTDTAPSTSEASQSPLSAYSHLQNGQLGKHFTLIKGHAAIARGDGLSDLTTDDPLSVCASSQDSRPQLPDWLCRTFSTLEPTNPLRLLLPQDTSPAVPPGLSEHLEGRERDLAPGFLTSPEDAPVYDSFISGSETQHKNPGLDPRTLGRTGFPLSDIAGNSFPANTTNTITPRTNTPDDQLITVSALKQLDFVPFSTPGPGATLSTSSRGKKISAPPPSNDLNESSTLDLPVVSLVLPQDSHSSDPAFSDQPPIAGHPSYPTSFHDFAPSYSSDDLLDFYEEQLTDDSGSDPNFGQGLAPVHELPNLFVTPKHSLPRPIYFDSPTEDPFDSDPLQPGFEIDYGNLDFQWHPYFRAMDPEIGKHKPDKRQSNITATDERPPSPSPFRFSLDEADYRAITALPKTSQPKNPERPTASAFAPAPGIYVSPLNGHDSSPPAGPRMKRKRALLESTDVGFDE